MIRALALVAPLLLALPAAAEPTYALVGEPGEQRLVARTAKGEITSGPLDDYMVLIEKEADFDNDGTPDVLYSTNCGGNGCPESAYAFATVRSGKLALVPIGMATEARVSQDGATWLVELIQEGGSKTFVFATGKAVPYATKTRTVLHALVEVKGEAPHGKGGKRSFKADVDLDGKPETITCTIWERWGSLLCTLPTPTGPQTLSTGCDRFGALPTSTQGRRDFVCNADLVLKFDGTKWNEPKAATP